MLRLGFVTELLSKPIRYGYMNGIALTVLISQLPKLFGFSIDALAAILYSSPTSASRVFFSPSSPRLSWLITEPRRYRQRKSSRSAAARITIVCLAYDQFWSTR
jgi:hypothetical protein